jgi:predicted PurR-regulated permease PerM
MQKFFTDFIAHPYFIRWLIIIGVMVTISAMIIQSLSGILAPFIAGFVGAYLFNKLACRLEHYIPRAVAAGLLILTFVVLITLISSVVLPYLQSELVLLAKGFPHFAELVVNQIQPFLSSVGETPLTFSSIKGQVSAYLGDIVKWSVQVVINLLTNGILLANLLSLIILTPIIMFYLLRDWPKILQQIDQNLSEKAAPTVRRMITAIDNTLTAYLIGQSTVCLSVAVLYVVGLYFVGIEKFLLLGIMTGILTFIPYLGMAIGLFASLSVAFTAFVGWGQILGVLIVFFIVSMIEGNILTPRFVGGRIGLHPVWILFALLAGGTWLGFVGILMAIPTAAIIGVIVREIMEDS